MNQDVVRALPDAEQIVEAVTANELIEMERRERAYRDDRPPIDVRGRIVILIDDGLATGATMHAAVSALREQEPAKIVVADAGVCAGDLSRNARICRRSGLVVCAGMVSRRWAILR